MKEVSKEYTSLTVKQLVACASLQAPIEGQFLNSEKFFQVVRENISSIEFIFISSQMISEHGEEIIQRLVSSKTITSTQSHHCFILMANGIEIFRLSADEMSTIVSREKSTTDQFINLQVKLGSMLLWSMA